MATPAMGLWGQEPRAPKWWPSSPSQFSSAGYLSLAYSNAVRKPMIILPPDALCEASAGAQAWTPRGPPNAPQTSLVSSPFPPSTRAIFIKQTGWTLEQQSHDDRTTQCRHYQWRTGMGSNCIPSILAHQIIFCLFKNYLPKNTKFWGWISHILGQN